MDRKYNASNRSSRAQLILSDIVLHVSIGWLPEERTQKQIILLTTTITFPDEPLACVSDNLADTFCYQQLVESIEIYLKNKEFKLLEYLGRELYKIIKNQLPPDHLLQIHLFKKPPMLKQITGGIRFCYGDL